MENLDILHQTLFWLMVFFAVTGCIHAARIEHGFQLSIWRWRRKVRRMSEDEIVVLRKLHRSAFASIKVAIDRDTMDWEDGWCYDEDAMKALRKSLVVLIAIQRETQ